MKCQALYRETFLLLVHKYINPQLIGIKNTYLSIFIYQSINKLFADLNLFVNVIQYLFFHNIVFKFFKFEFKFLF